MGGITITDGVITGADVSACTGAGGTPADGSITLAKLHAEVTATALSGCFTIMER